MKITKHELKKIIKEERQKALKEQAGDFAPTAAEEAVKINSQVSGMALQTDQSYWEEAGITTGEELALSLLSQNYSDMYKSIYGIRPRWESFDTVDQVQAALDDLDQEYEDMLAAEELAAQQQTEYEKKEREIEELMPGEFDFQHIPTRAGMGRRVEAPQLRMMGKQLKKIIREVVKLDLEKGDVILTGRFKNKRTVVKDIGKDDLGQPTINGMKALSFRIEKLMPKNKWSKKSLEALDFAEKVEKKK